MKEDPIFQKLLDHEVRLRRIEETMVTKQEFGEFKNELFTTLDHMTTVLNRLDQERVFTFETIKRMQNQIDDQQKEINTIKERLDVR